MISSPYPLRGASFALALSIFFRQEGGAGPPVGVGMASGNPVTSKMFLHLDQLCERGIQNVKTAHVNYT